MQKYLLPLSIILLILSCNEPTISKDDDEPVYHDIYYEYGFGLSEELFHIKMSYTTPDKAKEETVAFIRPICSWKSETYKFASREYIEYDVEKIDQLDRGWMGWSFAIYLDGVEWKKYSFLYGDQHKRLYGTIP